MEKLKKEKQTSKHYLENTKTGSSASSNNKLFNRKILFLFKVIITTIILWLIFRKIDFNEVFLAASGISLTIFMLLILISIIKFVTQYKNWESCLKITTEYQPAKNEILKSHFIGQALRFLIPGGHATFAKVYFVTNKKRATLFSIGIERFMQTWTNLWFASFAGFFYFKQFPFYMRLGGVVIITLIPVAVYWSSRALKMESWKDYFSQYIRIVPVITLRQILFVFLTVFQYFLIINQFYTISLVKLLISVPLILIANIIPITYAGLGLRETFAIYLLRDFDIQPEIAVTASLIIFLINSVLPAIVGLFFILTTKKQNY
ncbi:MAG: flippase-like domain-containing protein [Candidatus Cloacimonetes bacterium]|nr:flippase-like domain-containing protein [Candidatus Cloacimonadota bacterium]